MSSIEPQPQELAPHLRDAYELLDLIFTKSSDIFILLRKQPTQIIYFNNQAGKYFTQCKSNAHFDINAISITAQKWKNFKTFQDLLLIEEGESEIFFQTPYGFSFWGETSISPMVFNREKLQLIRIKDITKKVRATQQLQLLEAAIYHAYDAVLITDSSLDFPHPKILYVNPSFCKMTGYAPEELIGKTPRILQGPRTDRKKLQKLKETLAKGEFFSTSVINYKKNGVPYMVEWHISPVRDKDRNITHWVSVQRDITEKVKAQRLLLKNKEKEAHARLLTIIRTQERERAYFAHALHEELGHVLSFLGMNFSIFAEKIKQLNLENSVAGSLASAQSLLEEVLAKVRDISWRLMPTGIEDFGLCGALEDLCKKIESRKSLQITFTCCDGLLSLKKTDEINVYRIVQELLDNVLAHAKATKVALIIQKTNNFLKITVKDNGVGFDKKATHKGYGLQNIQTRVKVLRGLLKVASTPGKGCKAQVIIPLLPAL
jgi:PAS domain S-box-containing protein